uniref:Cell wall protein DAN4-like n=1 Tax=Diabrotica virgifera virgifera TaxID=50390 RepID=A0A6P7GLG4_DIAVI
MPTSPMTISATASTVPETVPTMKTTITYYMPTGEEILMPETELPTTQKFSPTTKPSSRPTKKYTTKSKTTKIPNSTKKPTKTTFSTTKRPTTTPKTSQLPSSTKKPIKTTISTTKTPTTTSIIPSTTKMYVKPISRTPTSPTTTKIIKTSTTPIPVTTSRPMTQKTSTKRPSGFTKFTKPSRKTTIPITTVTTTTIRVTTTSPMPPTVISTQYQAPTKTTEHAEGTSTEYQTSPQPTASTEVISTQYQAPTKTTIPSTEMPTTIVTTTSPTTLMSTTSPQVEETSTEPATVTEETGTTKITTTNFETTSTTLPSTEYETKLPTAEITTEKTTVPEETVTTSLESTSTETTTQTPFSTMTTTASTTTKTTTKPTSRRTTTPSDFLTEAEPYNGPIYVGSVKNDYSLDDIFGPTTQTEKPTSTSTTRHTESDISQQLFGGELPENSKIIFSGFYEASTTANEDNDRKKKASQILTSQSYETEVSYEVNKRSNTESVGVLTTSTLRTPTKPMFRKSLKNRKFDYTRKKPSRALKTTSTTTAVETTTMESTSVQKVTTEGTALFADPPVEAIHQALLREGYWEPNLRERLTGAQLIGRQDHATPFGDVAVLARGQLYAIHAGNFMLLQDPYQNDCDDCYNPRRCERHDCQPYSPHNQEILVALWTVKRIRHRDVDRTRFDLEYIVSPLNANNDQIIMRRGKFNYAIPGHVFAVRSGKSEKNYPEVRNLCIIVKIKDKIDNIIYTHRYLGVNTVSVRIYEGVSLSRKPLSLAYCSPTGQSDSVFQSKPHIHIFEF